jgi:hypothetical protein
MNAALSIFDMATDISMIVEFASQGEMGYAKSLGAMVGSTLAFELLVVYCQNRKGPTTKMIKESLIVLTIIKPGVDAHRVANGEDQAEYAVVSPELELTSTKVFEMVCESIPGTLLQVRRGAPPN